MKKMLSIIIALTLKASFLNAQTMVFNPSFEDQNSDGSIQHWGYHYIMQIWFDSLGNSHSDSIVYDNQFYGLSTDAYSGSKALELRNAWNFTDNSGIAGSISADDDSIFTSWGNVPMISVSNSGGSIFRPSTFSFHHKFFPVNGDSAVAQIILYDFVGNQVGEGLYIISNASNTYNLTQVPIQYSSSDTVASYSLVFSNFYTSSLGSHQPSFGTYLLIDDVQFGSNITTGINSPSVHSNISIYPNPAGDFLNIQSKDECDFQFYIYNKMGQMVKMGSSTYTETSISIADLKEGHYHILIKSDEYSTSLPFIKVN